MSQINLYDAMKACGVQIENHHSDMYVPVTPLTTSIIKASQFARSVTTFRDNISGKLWYDIPFAYSPWRPRSHAQIVADDAAKDREQENPYPVKERAVPPRESDKSSYRKLGDPIS